MYPLRKAFTVKRIAVALTIALMGTIATGTGIIATAHAHPSAVLSMGQHTMTTCPAEDGLHNGQPCMFTDPQGNRTIVTTNIDD